MKRLFLASEAGDFESIRKLEKFIGGFRGKSIAYIPTASNGENEYDWWRENSSTWKLVNTLGANVEVVVLEDYKNSSVIKHLKGKDILWFAGGACGYLMYWVRRCEIDKQINDLLESGSVYVGSSAGSMICGKTLEIAEVFVGEEEKGAGVIPGFGLIDFDFYPHYEDEMLTDIKKVWSGGDLYLVKNGEVVTVEDDKITVLGEKRILRKGELL